MPCGQSVAHTNFKIMFIGISNKELIKCVTGVIYRMHPYHKPEGIDVIVDKIQEEFKNKNDGKDYTFLIVRFDEDKEFETWLKNLLMGIKEFTDYNISRKLKDAGVKDANDERNGGFKFVDRYTVEKEDSRYSDFIDLDAGVRNIICEVYSSIDSDSDCFLCKYAKEYGSMEPGDERCKLCLCNPKIRNMREPHPMSLKPKNQWTEEEKKLYNIR